MIRGSTIHIRHTHSNERLLMVDSEPDPILSTISYASLRHKLAD